MKRYEWIWPGWLARGKLHVLGGGKGAGKSTLTFYVLAAITIGGKLPDGKLAPLGDVLIWSSEDDFEDTILPRIVAMGGDRNRVYFIKGVTGADGKERYFDPATDMDALIEAAAEIPGLLAVMIDPIVSAVSADSHKNAETRRGLQPLVNMASERGTAVIGITHFTKNTQGKNPIERITGSLAFGALPRILWGAAKDDQDDDAPRKLVRIGSNIGKDGGGFEYLLEQAAVAGEDFQAQRVVWGKQLDGSAADLMARSQEISEAFKARAFLERELTVAGVPQKEVEAAAKGNGLSWATVRRAKEALGVVSFKEGTWWVWALPVKIDDETIRHALMTLQAYTLESAVSADRLAQRLCPHPPGMEAGEWTRRCWRIAAQIKTAAGLEGFRHGDDLWFIGVEHVHVRFQDAQPPTSQLRVSAASRVGALHKI